MPAWAESTARVETQVAYPARTKTPRPKAVARRVAPRSRVAGGVVWIAAFAVLLAGVVALNVAVLRLNMKLDDLGRERTELRTQNNALESQIASGAADARIQAIAKHRGLVQADLAHTTFLDVGVAAR